MPLRSIATVLLLLQSTAVVAFTSEDFRVQGLEKVEPAFETFQGEMYAGLLPIDEESGGKLMCTWLGRQMPKRAWDSFLFSCWLTHYRPFFIFFFSLAL